MPQINVTIDLTDEEFARARVGLKRAYGQTLTNAQLLAAYRLNCVNLLRDTVLAAEREARRIAVDTGGDPFNIT